MFINPIHSRPLNVVDTTQGVASRNSSASTVKRNDNGESMETGKKWVWGLVVLLGALAVAAIVSLFRRGKSDDGGKDSGSKWNDMREWIDDLSMREQYGENGKAIKSVLSTMADKMEWSDTKDIRFSPLHFYDLATQFIYREKDLYQTAQALSLLVAMHLYVQFHDMAPKDISVAMRDKASQKMTSAMQTMLAMRRGDLGWAEFFSYQASSKDREGKEKKLFLREEVEGYRVRRKINTWNYGVYFLDDFLAALMRGAINVEKASKSKKVGFIQRLMNGEKADRMERGQRDTLQTARMNALWVMTKLEEETKRVGQSHPALEHFAERIIDAVDVQAARLSVELPPVSIKEMIDEEMMGLPDAGTYLPMNPDQASLEDWDDITPPYVESVDCATEDTLSYTARNMLDHIAEDMEKDASTTRVTQTALAQLIVYWGEHEYAQTAKNALRVLWNNRVEDVGRVSADLMLTFDRSEDISGTHERKVVSFIHDLARAGLYYEAARGIEDSKEKTAMLANISTTDLSSCHQLALPQKLSNYVTRFQTMIRRLVIVRSSC